MAAFDVLPECMGLSPQVRGNLMQDEAITFRGGSIPAGAGEPYLTAFFFGDPGVYPRRCGGTLLLPRRPLAGRRKGLSPQVRGNLKVPSPAFVCTGSIPAGAGEPFRKPGMCLLAGVYPRRCGGT